MKKLLTFYNQHISSNHILSEKIIYDEWSCIISQLQDFEEGNEKKS